MNASECIFCKIVTKEISSKIVYEDEKIIAIEDINPAAPLHILLIPKQHIASLDEVEEQDAGILGHIQLTASRIAKEKGISKKGYRVVNNCGVWGGQTIAHLHYHLLGGREMAWPPG